MRTVQVYNELMRTSGVTSPYLVKHVIEEVRDYDLAEYMLEHTRPTAS